MFKKLITLMNEMPRRQVVAVMLLLYLPIVYLFSLNLFSLYKFSPSGIERNILSQGEVIKLNLASHRQSQKMVSFELGRISIIATYDSIFGMGREDALSKALHNYESSKRRDLKIRGYKGFEREVASLLLAGNASVFDRWTRKNLKTIMLKCARAELINQSQYYECIFPRWEMTGLGLLHIKSENKPSAVSSIDYQTFPYWVRE